MKTCINVVVVVDVVIVAATETPAANSIAKANEYIDCFNCLDHVTC